MIFLLIRLFGWLMGITLMGDIPHPLFIGRYRYLLIVTPLHYCWYSLCWFVLLFFCWITVFCSFCSNDVLLLPLYSGDDVPILVHVMRRFITLFGDWLCEYRYLPRSFRLITFIWYHCYNLLCCYILCGGKIWCWLLFLVISFLRDSSWLLWNWPACWLQLLLLLDTVDTMLMLLLPCCLLTTIRLLISILFVTCHSLVIRFLGGYICSSDSCSSFCCWFGWWLLFCWRYSYSWLEPVTLGTIRLIYSCIYGILFCTNCSTIDLSSWNWLLVAWNVLLYHGITELLEVYILPLPGDSAGYRCIVFLCWLVITFDVPPAFGDCWDGTLPVYHLLLLRYHHRFHSPFKCFCTIYLLYRLLLPFFLFWYGVSCSVCDAVLISVDGMRNLTGGDIVVFRSVVVIPIYALRAVRYSGILLILVLECRCSSHCGVPLGYVVAFDYVHKLRLPGIAIRYCLRFHCSLPLLLFPSDWWNWCGYLLYRLLYLFLHCSLFAFLLSWLFCGGWLLITIAAFRLLWTFDLEHCWRWNYRCSICYYSHCITMFPDCWCGSIYRWWAVVTDCYVLTWSCYLRCMMRCNLLILFVRWPDYPADAFCWWPLLRLFCWVLIRWRYWIPLPVCYLVVGLPADYLAIVLTFLVVVTIVPVVDATVGCVGVWYFVLSAVIWHCWLFWSFVIVRCDLLCYSVRYDAGWPELITVDRYLVTSSNLCCRCICWLISLLDDYRDGGGDLRLLLFRIATCWLPIDSLPIYPFGVTFITWVFMPPTVTFVPLLHLEGTWFIFVTFLLPLVMMLWNSLVFDWFVDSFGSTRPLLPCCWPIPWWLRCDYDWPVRLLLPLPGEFRLRMTPRFIRWWCLIVRCCAVQFVYLCWLYGDWFIRVVPRDYPLRLSRSLFNFLWLPEYVTLFTWTFAARAPFRLRWYRVWLLMPVPVGGERYCNITARHIPLIVRCCYDTYFAVDATCATGAVYHGTFTTIACSSCLPRFDRVFSAWPGTDICCCITWLFVTYHSLPFVILLLRWHWWTFLTNFHCYSCRYILYRSFRGNLLWHRTMTDYTLLPFFFILLLTCRILIHLHLYFTFVTFVRYIVLIQYGDDCYYCMVIQITVFTICPLIWIRYFGDVRTVDGRCSPRWLLPWKISRCLIIAICSAFLPSGDAFGDTLLLFFLFSPSILPTDGYWLLLLSAGIVERSCTLLIRTGDYVTRSRYRITFYGGTCWYSFRSLFGCYWWTTVIPLFLLFVVDVRSRHAILRWCVCCLLRISTLSSVCSPIIRCWCDCDGTIRWWSCWLRRLLLPLFIVGRSRLHLDTGDFDLVTVTGNFRCLPFLSRVCAVVWWCNLLLRLGADSWFVTGWWRLPWVFADHHLRCCSLLPLSMIPSIPVADCIVRWFRSCCDLFIPFAIASQFPYSWCRYVVLIADSPFLDYSARFDLGILIDWYSDLYLFSDDLYLTMRW